MAESETLLEERRGAVVLLTLNRPESRNAVNQQLADALEGAFTRLREDDAVRVVVVTGSGAAFCSGADLKQGGPVETGRFLEGTQRPLTHAVDGFPKLSSRRSMVLLSVVAASWSWLPTCGLRRTQRHSACLR